MGDIRKILDKAVDEILNVGDAAEITRASIETALWALWEASYRDGYRDATIDLTEEDTDAT